MGDTVGCYTLSCCLRALTPWKLTTHYTLWGCKNCDSYQRTTSWRWWCCLYKSWQWTSPTAVCVFVYICGCQWTEASSRFSIVLNWFGLCNYGYFSGWVHLRPLLKLWYVWPRVHERSFWRITACKHTILPIEIILFSEPIQRDYFHGFFTTMLIKTFLCQGHWNLSSFLDLLCQLSFT